MSLSVLIYIMVPPDGVVADIGIADFSSNPVFLLIDLVMMDNWLPRSPLTVQVVVVCPDRQEIGLGSGVANHQVTVVIEAGGPAAKGLGSVAVGEHVIAVAVAFHHGKGRVEGNPVDEIGQGAQATSYGRGWAAVQQDHALLVSLPAGGVTDEPPKGEDLAWFHHHSVQSAGGKLQVDNLSLLQGCVLRGKIATQWGTMTCRYMGKVIGRLLVL